MYHGNGGGQTESYHRVADGDGDPYPYLRSTKYPFADPSRWTKETTFGAITAALRASDVALPGEVDRIEITERGDSPRVIKMRLSGAAGSTDVRGTTFADALELRSTWFDFERADSSGAMVTGDVLAAPLGGIGAVGPGPTTAAGTGWAGVLIAIAALAGLAGAEKLQRRKRSADG
jgi:peptidoglycan hydrolase-like amidase